MIPIRDDNPRRLFPLFTILLIAVNVAVFIYQLTLSPSEAQTFILTYGAVPKQIIQGRGLYTIITSMFVHGGILHLLGNMLYLWIFADNIEGICGYVRFLIFYFICGIAAFAGHFILDPVSTIPMVGASGAISGILGAYALRFPRARVHILFPLFPFIWLWRIIRVPAVFALGFWFLIQIFNAVMSSRGSGVAWFAHIGGFIAGLILIRVFEKKRYRVYL